MKKSIKKYIVLIILKIQYLKYIQFIIKKLGLESNDDKKQNLQSILNYKIEESKKIIVKKPNTEKIDDEIDVLDIRKRMIKRHVYKIYIYRLLIIMN